MIHFKSKKMTCINCCCSVTSMERNNNTENLNIFLTSVFGNVLHSNSTVLNNITICNNCNSYANKLWYYRNSFLKQTDPESKINRITEQDGKVKKFFGLDKDVEMPNNVNQEFITCDSETPSQSQNEITVPEIESNSYEQDLNEEIVSDIYREKILELKIQKLQLSELHQKYLPKTVNPVHSCEKCSRNFPSQEILQSHGHSAHTSVEFNFSCHFCKKSFSYYWFYKNHLKINHSGIEMKFSCSICRENVHSQKELDQHNFSVHQITSHPFKCNFCDVAFETVEEIEKLRSHLIETHGDTKEAKAARVNVEYIIERQKWFKKKTGKPCNCCGKFIKGTLFRTVHILFEHHDKKSCQICKEIFDSQENFRDHIKSSGHRLDTCAVCGAGLRRLENLLKHLQSAHMEKRFRFSCEICGSVFCEFHQLKKHYKHHSDKANPRRFSCNQCDKLFTLKHQLKMHMVVHDLKNNATEELIKCKYCEKTFKGIKRLQMMYLNMHITKCHAEELEKETALTFKCLEPDCGKIFLSVQSLHRHKRKHVFNISHSSRTNKSIHANEYSKNYIKTIIKDGVKKFQCGLCEKIVPRIDHLRRHLFLKHTVKFNAYIYAQLDVECEVCGKIIQDSYKLKNHMAVVHQGNHVPKKKVPKKNRQQYKCTLCDTICGIYGMRDHILALHPDTKEASAAANNIKRIKEDDDIGLKSKHDLVQNDFIKKAENCCLPCNILFPTISDKYAHDNQFHKTLFPCKICKEEFSSEENLKKHQSSHSSLNCHHCVSIFDYLEDYYGHLQIKHSLHPYICEFCGLFFSTKTRVMIHYRVIHSNTESITDSSQNKTDQHKKVDHGQGNEFEECKYCEKIFKGYHRNVNIKKHIIKCHTEELHKETTFKCPQPECGLIFVTARSLNLHNGRLHKHNLSDSSRATKSGHVDESSKNLIKPVIQDGVRKFQCGLCEIIISTKTHLHRHLLRKHEVKFDSVRYGSVEIVKCEICDKILKDKYKLKGHMASFHNGNLAKSVTSSSKNKTDQRKKVEEKKSQPISRSTRRSGRILHKKPVAHDSTDSDTSISDSSFSEYST